MTVVLGIDAAWTAAEPSGVAVVASDGAGHWRCVALAPSYQAFVELASGTPVNWTQPKFRGSEPDVAQLIAAAQQLAQQRVDVVTVDMPIATLSIDGRRAADSAISTRFGAQGCSAHTPNVRRPGPLGARITRGFESVNFRVATNVTPPGTLQRLVEVYPHPALLALLQRGYRVPYKIAKSKSYWKESSIAQRISKLLSELGAIHAALEANFGELSIPLPKDSMVSQLTGLKRYEDALDALVCAWVGVRYVTGSALAFGDETAAVWCPDDVPLHATR
jgi:predicted RNase H-like nuclease